MWESIHQMWSKLNHVLDWNVGLVIFPSFSIFSLFLKHLHTQYLFTDPLSMSPQKALEAIGCNLQKQYERWQPRARYKQTLDPTADEVHLFTNKINLLLCLYFKKIILNFV